MSHILLFSVIAVLAPSLSGLAGVLDGEPATAAVLQDPAGPVDLDTQELQPVDALRCWRRIGRNAVQIGEHFTMTVTCRVIETDAARTAPDEAALQPQSIDVAPFEVLDGQRYSDVQDDVGRLFQFHYTLRVNRRRLLRHRRRDPPARAPLPHRPNARCKRGASRP